MKKFHSILLISLFFVFSSCGKGPEIKVNDVALTKVLTKENLKVKTSFLPLLQFPEGKSEKISSILGHFKILKGELLKTADAQGPVAGLLAVGKDLDHWTQLLKDKLKEEGHDLRINSYYENGQELKIEFSYEGFPTKGSCIFGSIEKSKELIFANLHFGLNKKGNEKSHLDFHLRLGPDLKRRIKIYTYKHFDFDKSPISRLLLFTEGPNNERSFDFIYRSKKDMGSRKIDYIMAKWGPSKLKAQTRTFDLKLKTISIAKHYELKLR